MNLLVAVFGAWGLVLTIPALMALSTGRVGEALATLLIAWVPSALLGWFLTARGQRRGALRDRALAEGGIQPGIGFMHEERGTGIALNPATRTLALWADGDCKAYPYGAVREWEARSERAGEVVAFGGVAAGMAAAGANSRAKRAAAASSGLFVTVRDVDRPKWRVGMAKEADQAQWMEILRQELNEGGAAPAPLAAAAAAGRMGV